MSSARILLRKPVRRISRNRTVKDGLRPRFRSLLLENLEERRLLSVNPFSSYANDLYTDLQAIQGRLDTTLDTVASLKSLPFIGAQLGKADQVKAVIDSVGSEIQSVLTGFSKVGVQASDLQNELYQALGPNGGLNILGAGNDGANSTSAAGDIHVTNFTTNGSGILETANVEMRLHEDAAVGSPSDMNFTVGVPSLPIQITSQGGITLTVGFDFELAIDYNAANLSLPISIDSNAKVSDYSPTLSPDQLVFYVTATLESNAQLTADLGLLTGTLVPTPNQTNQLQAEVDVDGLRLSGSPTVAFSGNTEFNLTATLGLGDGAPYFPSVSTDLTMNWSDLTDPSTLSFSYNNLSLNLGEYLSKFVGPIVSDIQQYTQPIRTVIDVLTTPIPGIDQLPGMGGFDLLDLFQDVRPERRQRLGGRHQRPRNLGDDRRRHSGPWQQQRLARFRQFHPRRVGDRRRHAPASALDLTNPLNLLGGEALSQIKTLDLTTQSGISGFNLGNALSQAGAPQADQTAATELNTNTDIHFPLLNDPSALLNLLFGQNVSLVTASVSATLTGTWPNFLSVFIPFPPLPVVGINLSLSAGFSASASLTVGYDTYGIREALAAIQGGSPSLSQIGADIINGFYIDSNPTDTGIKLTGTLTGDAGPAVDLGVAGGSLDVQGQVQATANVYLNPSLAVDDEIRFSELTSQPFTNLFAGDGSITATLSLVAEYWFIPPWEPWKTDTGSYTFWSVSTTLWSFSWGGAGSGTPVISGLTADSGPTAGSADVYIYGSNLYGATVTVDFGGAPAGIVSDQAGYILVTTPPGSAGAVNVQVTTSGGSTTDSNAYTYIPPPAVSSVATGAFTPPGGPESGGTQVTITGTDLQNATAVDFGNGSAGTIISDSAGTIVALSPAGSGAVDVTVVTPGGNVGHLPVRRLYLRAGADHYQHPPIGRAADGREHGHDLWRESRRRAST